MSSDLRIAQVLPALNRGGMERFTIALGELLKQQYPVQLFCTSDGGPLLDVTRERGLTVKVARSPLLANVRPTALVDAMTPFGPTVVHSHSGSWLKAAIAGRKVGAHRIVHTIHGFHEGRLWLHEPIERVAVRRTDIVVAVSQEQAAYASERLFAPDSKIRVIQNGIDTSRFKPIAIERRERASVQSNRFVIGFIGRLIDVKDPLLLLDTFHRVTQLLSGQTEVQLEFVGDGPLRSTLESRVSEFSESFRIKVHGAVDDVEQYLARFDLLVLPSRSEGTSIAALEAMAAGCPVVAFDVGGNTDLLRGESGYLVRERSSEALAYALAECITTPNRLREIAERALRRVNDSFSLHATTTKYLELYHS